jgi:hypothetical protein
MRILWHATHLTPASSSCFLFLFLRIGSNRPVFELRTQCVSAVSARATPRVSVGLPASVGRRPLPRHARGSVLHGAAWCVCVAHWSSRPPWRSSGRAPSPSGSPRPAPCQPCCRKPQVASGQVAAFRGVPLGRLWLRLRSAVRERARQEAHSQPPIGSQMPPRGPPPGPTPPDPAPGPQGHKKNVLIADSLCL